MGWEHLSITKSHLVYIILGGFTSLFMLCSSVIKERMYIGEATVATLCGLIFGPHAANLINPLSWGNVDEITLEFSRIVLVVQCFAVGVELPKFYMEKHWKSVSLLLVPVMTFGWLITSLVVWWLIPALNWLESLTVAACVTATDPVLASSVVGKGKFAKRVPKHLRDLLSAESGCNDGMAFPFIYLALYLIQDHLDARETTFHWLVYTVLYECIFGAVYGFLIGYFARHGIKYAERRDLIDRESFLVFYFTLALFCAGSGSILGVDDLLVGFAAGVGFSNDGWFSSKTEESHVSNVIDLLLNLTYFVYLGTIIPWEQFNNPELGLTPWRLVVIAIFVVLFRRIPIMMALKPFIPDIKTWREALFAGHFGPIGVGAIFVAILARGELEHEVPIPLSKLPPEDSEHYVLISLVWPIVTFMVVTSILVHGSSVAVFTLGKRINTLTLTMSYTQANEDGPSWMNRLPRISSISKSQARTASTTDFDDVKLPEFPPGTLPPTGLPGQFLRRKRDEEEGKTHSRSSSIVGRRRSRKKWDDGIGPGGPVSQSAIFPQRRSQGDMDTLSPMTPRGTGTQSPDRRDTSGTLMGDESSGQLDEKESEKAGTPAQEETDDRNERVNILNPNVEIYDEHDHIVIEDEQGQVLAVEPGQHEQGHIDVRAVAEKAKDELKKPGWTLESLKKKLGDWKQEEAQKRKTRGPDRKHEPARAYQFGNTIIVEDEDGEVVKKYELPATEKPEGSNSKYMANLRKQGHKAKEAFAGQAPEDAPSGSTKPAPPIWSRPSFTGWTGGLGKAATGDPKKKAAVTEEEENDDRNIRFTLQGQGRRMTKDDFLQVVQNMDARTRSEALESSDASALVKAEAKRGAASSSRDAGAGEPKPKGPSRVATGGGSSVATGSKVSARSQGDDSPIMRGRTGAALTKVPSAVPSANSAAPSTEEPETAVERRRRMAALGVSDSGQASGSGSGEASGSGSGERPSSHNHNTADNSEPETAAERRRREAVLGVGSGGEAPQDSDSDDDDTPRVPPTRRGIRFAEPAKPGEGAGK